MPVPMVGNRMLSATIELLIGALAASAKVVTPSSIGFVVGEFPIDFVQAVTYKRNACNNTSPGSRLHPDIHFSVHYVKVRLKLRSGFFCPIDP